MEFLGIDQLDTTIYATAPEELHVEPAVTVDEAMILDATYHPAAAREEIDIQTEQS
jgi:hypothetical protein